MRDNVLMTVSQNGINCGFGMIMQWLPPSSDLGRKMSLKNHAGISGNSIREAEGQQRPTRMGY